jgi:hypothetical protein
MKLFKIQEQENASLRKEMEDMKAQKSTSTP